MARPFSALPRFANELSVEINEGSTKLLRTAAAITLSQVVQRSPVDTGRLRSNWQVGVNSPPGGVVGNGGVASIPTITDAGAKVYISNNVRYINFVNNGIRGNQANAGFIQAAVIAAVGQIRGARIVGD